MVSSPEQMIGAVFARRYQLVACLGSGAVGVVFEARDLDSGGPCAVKTLHDGAAEPHDVISAWITDRNAARQLVHPHIAACRDVSLADDGSPYVAMDLLDGAPLGAYLKPGLAYGALHALPIAKAALSAIHEAHERGLVHGDLKPTNLFMMRKEDAPPMLQVLDFGCARVLELRRSARVGDRALEADAKYLSPEQRAGARATFSDDLWALSVVLYELITGQDPFAGMAGLDSGTRPTGPESFQAHLLTAQLACWRGFFAKAFAASAAQRFHSAADVQRELSVVERAVQSMPAGDPAPSITDLSPAMAAFVGHGALAPQVEVLGAARHPRSDQRHILETTLPGATLTPPDSAQASPKRWRLLMLVAVTAAVAFGAGYVAGHW